MRNTVPATEPTLAQRYDPAPRDADRYETAIGRWYKAWAAWREAADLMAATALRGSDATAVVQNYNYCLDEYERARADFIRERVIWQTAGVPW